MIYIETVRQSLEKEHGKDIKEMKERLKDQGYKDDIINQNEEFIRGVKGLKYN